MERLQRKRTERSLNSKRKRWLRNRGMTRQDSMDRVNRQTWAWESFLKIKNMPTRGVRANLKEERKAQPIKRGFLARIFKRPSA